MRIIQFVFISFGGLISLANIFAQYIPKPWPSYSLDNMPKTSFSCQGKILGGYYADPETQCQMFHVCVKVAGVGVKDFRFLCPNGTAFDQEAQICADWGDVDCEQAILYYSSDNFDLYRLGSGFESKRAPVAEDEQPFHLQNAESNDLRRTTQQNRNSQTYDQNNGPSDGESAGSYSGKRNYANTRKIQKNKTIAPTTTTTTSTTESTYQADRRGDDEIFKGSHSSNFFNNQNNGKEDDLADFPRENNQAYRGRHRNQNNYKNLIVNNNNNIQSLSAKNNAQSTQTVTKTSTTTFAPPSTIQLRQIPYNNRPIQGNLKTVSLQTNFRADEFRDNESSGLRFYTSSTESGPFSSTNYQPQGNNNYKQSNNHYQLGSNNNQQVNMGNHQGNNDYQHSSLYYKSTTQERIQPTTYSPALSIFTSENSSPKYEDFRRYDKTLTTPTQKFTQSSHNSFYNVQFENKATESYDQRKELVLSNQLNDQPIYNKTTQIVDDVSRSASKPTSINIQRQTPFNEGHMPFADAQNSFANRQNSFNEKQDAFTERQNKLTNGQISFNDRQNSFTEGQRSFNEKQTSFDGGQSNQEPTTNNARKSDDSFLQRKPLRSRRPIHQRNQDNSNKAPSVETDVYNPLNVHPLSSQTQSIVKTSKNGEQANYNEFNNNNFRSAGRFQNGNNIPEAFDVSRSVPAPFSLPPEQQTKPVGVANNTQQSQGRLNQSRFQTLPTFNELPRGFSLSPPHANDHSKIDNTTPKSKRHEEPSYDNYTPSLQAKKFSTLVPKDQFYPTTFKPATYRKLIQGYNQKLETSTKFAASSYLPTSTTTTHRPQRVRDEIDEDDGQYHPELYEKDFARNKVKTRKHQSQSFDGPFDRRPAEPHTDTEDEEFLNTAHSLNIAAGANQLRAEKNQLSSPAVFRVSSTPLSTTATTKSTVAPKSRLSSKLTNKNSKGANEDTSYDYAYYDSFSGNPQDYEYDLVSDFGKTRKN